MKIKLTEKYKPFSHEVGTSLLIPGSMWNATIYPAKIELKNLLSISNKQTFDIIPHITAPLQSFTVMQDLDRHWIRVFGLGPQGYFSYRLIVASQEIILLLERGPKEGILFTHAGKAQTLTSKGELIIATLTSAFPKEEREKMHFGCQKKQDWRLVKRRKSVEEILPIWFELGKHIPFHPILNIGTSKLLAKCQEEIQRKEKDKIGSSFLELFNAGFEGILSPRLSDDAHLGYGALASEIPRGASPLVLLGEGARLIRSLLVQEKDQGFAILPCLPKELHAGRFVDITLAPNLTADLEWSKKLLRCLVFHPKKDREIRLSFQSSIKIFRLRAGQRSRGKILRVGTSIKLKANTLYVLDRFQK